LPVHSAVHAGKYTACIP